LSLYLITLGAAILRVVIVFAKRCTPFGWGGCRNIASFIQFRKNRL